MQAVPKDMWYTGPYTVWIKSSSAEESFRNNKEKENTYVNECNHARDVNRRKRKEG